MTDARPAAGSAHSRHRRARPGPELGAGGRAARDQAQEQHADAAGRRAEGCGACGSHGATPLHAAWEASLTLGVGDTVVRGPSWKWGDADGGEGRRGKVTKQVSDGWFEVAWDSGRHNKYRFGAGVYDVIALREVYNGLFGQQIPRIDWFAAGYPLPEHVRWLALAQRLSCAQIDALDRPVVIRNYIPPGWQPLQWTVDSMHAYLPKDIDVKCIARNRWAPSAPSRQLTHCRPRRDGVPVRPPLANERAQRLGCAAVPAQLLRARQYGDAGLHRRA